MAVTWLVKYHLGLEKEIGFCFMSPINHQKWYKITKVHCWKRPQGVF